MRKLIILAIAVISITACSTAFKNLTASLPDLGNKPNGVYRGEYSVAGTPVDVIADVTVQNGQLTFISIIKHTSSPIGKRAEKIIDSIIAKQSLDIDAVSGATASSKAILKAVENALE